MGDWILTWYSCLLRNPAPRLRGRRRRTVRRPESTPSSGRLHGCGAPIGEQPQKRQRGARVRRRTHAQDVRSAKADWDKAVLDLKTTPLLNPVDAEKLQLAVEQAEASYRQLARETPLIEESQRAQVRILALNLEQARIEQRRAEATSKR